MYTPVRHLLADMCTPVLKYFILLFSVLREAAFVSASVIQSLFGEHFLSSENFGRILLSDPIPTLSDFNPFQSSRSSQFLITLLKLKASCPGVKVLQNFETVSLHFYGHFIQNEGLDRVIAFRTAFVAVTYFFLVIETKGYNWRYLAKIHTCLGVGVPGLLINAQGSFFYEQPSMRQLLILACRLVVS